MLKYLLLGLAILLALAVWYRAGVNAARAIRAEEKLVAGDGKAASEPVQALGSPVVDGQPGKRIGPAVK